MLFPRVLSASRRCSTVVSHRWGVVEGTGPSDQRAARASGRLGGRGGTAAMLPSSNKSQYVVRRSRLKSSSSDLRFQPPPMLIEGGRSPERPCLFLFYWFLACVFNFMPRTHVSWFARPWRHRRYCFFRSLIAIVILSLQPRSSGRFPALMVWFGLSPFFFPEIWSKLASSSSFFPGGAVYSFHCYPTIFCFWWSDLIAGLCVWVLMQVDLGWTHVFFFFTCPVLLEWFFSFL
jgi:hypothetical protein